MRGRELGSTRARHFFYLIKYPLCDGRSFQTTLECFCSFAHPFVPGAVWFPVKKDIALMHARRGSFALQCRRNHGRGARGGRGTRKRGTMMRNKTLVRSCSFLSREDCPPTVACSCCSNFAAAPCVGTAGPPGSISMGFFAFFSLLLFPGCYNSTKE